MFLRISVSHLRPWIVSKGGIRTLLSWIIYFKVATLSLWPNTENLGFTYVAKFHVMKIYPFIHYGMRMRYSLVWKALTKMLLTYGIFIRILVQTSPDENSYFSEENIEPMKNALLACCKITKKAIHYSLVLISHHAHKMRHFTELFRRRNESWMTQLSQMIEKSRPRSSLIVEISYRWEFLIIPALVLDMHNIGHISMRCGPLWKCLDSAFRKGFTSVRWPADAGLVTHEGCVRRPSLLCPRKRSPTCSALNQTQSIIKSE